jgi:dTDP-4-amino-4,6-dideoxygalactose transaminase
VSVDVAERLGERLVAGPETRHLELEIAARVGATGAVAFATEVEAFSAALRVLGVRAGQKVTVPVLGGPEAAIAATRLGCRLRFADVDQTLTLTGELEGPTIAVHTDGYPVDAAALKVRTELPIIEDARVAFGARRDRQVGALGDLAVFSLGPWSVLRAGAGAVVTFRSAELYRPLKAQARYAPLAEVVALFARQSLEEVDARVEQAREVAAIFDDAVRNLDSLIPPQRPSSGLHSFGAYRLLATDDDAASMLERFKRAGLPFRAAQPPVTRHKMVHGRRDHPLVGESLPALMLNRPPWRVDPEVAESVASLLEEF